MKDSAAERQALSLQVGQRIRTIRKQRGLSLEALALKCDMNAAFLGHIERGLRCPTLYTLDGWKFTGQTEGNIQIDTTDGS